MSDQVVRIIISESGAAPAAAAVQRIGVSAEGAAAGVDTLKTSMLQLQGALAAAGLVLGIQQILGLGEAYQNTVQKLRNNATSAEDLANKEMKLFEIAMKTRQGLDDLAKTYTGMDKAVKAMGGTSEESMKITENLAKAMTASGKDAEEVGGAIKRLGLAFATGQANGRTFQTLFMQFPELLNLVAKHISGVNGDVGKLRSGLNDGSITARQMLEALRDMGGEGSELEKKFARVEITVKGAWVNMGTALERYIGQSDQAWGVTNKLALTIDFVANHIELVMPLVSGLGVAIALLGVKMIGTSAAATGLLTAIGANKWALIIGAIVALGGLFINLAEKINLTADGSVTAMGVIVGAWNLLKQAISGVLGYLTTFINYLTGANFNTTTVAVYGLATAFAVLAASQIVSFLRTMTVALFAAIPGMVAFVGTVGAFILEGAIFVATITAMTYAFATFSDATGITNGAVDNLGKATSKVAEVVKNTLGKAVTEATAAVKAGALANKEYSGTFKDTQSAAGGAAEGVKQYQTAVDSLNKSYDSAIQKENQFRENELKATEDQIMKNYKAVIDCASAHDALGRALHSNTTAAAGFKREVYDLTGAQQNDYNTVAKGSQANMQWYDTWTTQAEHDLDQLIAKEDEAASKARQTPLGPGGSGTPLGSFTTMGPSAISRSNALYRVDEAQSKLDLMRAKDEVAGITSDAIADALEKAIALAKAKIRFIDLKGGPDMHGLDRPYDGIGAMPQFAGGGSFTVGGWGGVDSSLVKFMASPGEKVTVSNGGSSSPTAQNPGITVHMHVQANDAQSFARTRTQRQIATQLKSGLQRIITL